MLNTNKRYVPREVDTEWAKLVLGAIRDGGTLIYPATTNQYRVDHTNKQLTLLNPEMLQASFHSFVIHQQSIEVFKAVGYAVVDGE